MQTIETIWNDGGRLSSLNYILAWIGVGLTLVGIAITASTLIIGRQVDKLNKETNTAKQVKIEAIVAEREEWQRQIEENDRLNS